jgi:hypothetical protein
MNKLLLLSAAGVMTIFAVALAVAWWEHRKRVQALQRQLAWSEQSRFMAEQQAGEAVERLAAIGRTLDTFRRPTPESAAEPDSAPAAPPLVDGRDTEPMVGCTDFAETLPLDIELQPPRG